MQRRRSARRTVFFTAFAGFAALALACTSFETSEAPADDDAGRADGPTESATSDGDGATDGGGASDAADAADASKDTGGDSEPACTYVTSDFSGSSGSSGASECTETDKFSCGTMTCSCFTDGGGLCRCDAGASFKHTCGASSCTPSAMDLAKCGFPDIDSGL